MFRGIRSLLKEEPKVTPVIRTVVVPPNGTGALTVGPFIANSF